MVNLLIGAMRKIGEYDGISYYSTPKIFTTNDEGYFIINGLTPGKYKITETNVPAGYDDSARSQSWTTTVYDYNRYESEAYKYVAYSIYTMFSEDDEYNAEKIAHSIFLRDVSKETITNIYSASSTNAKVSSNINSAVYYIFNNYHTQNINFKYKNESSCYINSGDENKYNIIDAVNSIRNNEKTGKFESVNDAKEFLKQYISKVYNDYYSSNKQSDNLYIRTYYERALGNGSKTIGNTKKGSSTGKLRIIKTDKETVLKNLTATFTVQRDSDKKYVSATKDDSHTYQNPTYKSTEDNSCKFVTTGGYFDIIGLTTGKYIITETVEPDGYKAVQTKYEVIVEDFNRYIGSEEKYVEKSIISLMDPNEKAYNPKTIIDAILLRDVNRSSIYEKIGSSANSSNPEKQYENSIEYIFKNFSNEEINYTYNGEKCYINSGDTNKYNLKDAVIAARKSYSYGKFEGYSDASNFLRGYLTEVYNKFYETSYSKNNKYSSQYLAIAWGYGAQTITNEQSKDLFIVKVDGTTNEIINGMVFYIKVAEKENQWLHKNNDGTYTITNSPTSFVTGTDGKSENDGTIYIKNIPKESYEIIEHSVGGNYKKYTVPENNITPVEINEISPDETKVTIENWPIGDKIKISGYVWQDKGGEFNNKNEYEGNCLYNEGNEKIDYRFANIKVALVDNDGNMIQETSTNEKGEYLFTDVESTKLNNYHIEFKYDGLLYKDVTLNLEKENGSKASEESNDGSQRNILNSQLNTISGNKSVEIDDNEYNLNFEKTQDGKVKLVDGTEISDLSDKVVSVTKEDNRFMITASTSTANLNLQDYYNTYYKGQDEIKNINLGLYKREKPDLRLEKDVFKADVSINDKTYVYHYDERLGKDNENIDTTLGVQFQSKRTGNYNLPIYRADAAYESQDKGLNITVTYKIALINQSTGLYSTVNSISEYFSNEYIYNNKIYIGDVKGEDTEELKDVGVTELATKEGYKAYNFSNLNVQIPPIKSKNGNVKYLYIEFNLPKTSYYDNASENKILDKELENIVEIASYSTYSDDGYSKPYAGIDEDSIPDSIQTSTPINTNIKDTSTYEDDTYKALGLNIVDRGNRTITGIVFEDNPIDEKSGGAGNERIGNGLFNDNEKKVSGVTVKLIEYDKEGNEITVKTGEGNEIKAETGTDGTYTLSGFIPGNYKIEFVWGDGNQKSTDGTTIYTVNDYKSTIWPKGHVLEGERWYATDVETQWSDAQDNWKLRQAIDADDTSTYTDLSKMISSTNNFSVGIEYVGEDQYDGNNRQYTISNIDFGLIERPRQSIEIKKEVNKVMISDSSGRPLVNAEIVEEDGVKKFKDDVKYAVYTESSALSPFGRVKAEIDTEAFPLTVDIEYKVSVINNSEIDYYDSSYYLYGYPSESATKVTIKPTKVYDYLDNVLSPVDGSYKDENGNTVTATTQTTTDYNSNVTESIFEKGYEMYKDYTDEYKNHVSEYMWKKVGKKYQAIFEEWSNSSQKTTREKKLVDKKIINLESLEGEIASGETKFVTYNVQGSVSSTDEIKLTNDAEIIDVKRTYNYGRKTTEVNTPIYDRGEEIIITPPTGENKDYTMTIIISISAIAVLGIGIIFIKKKVLK